MLKIKELREEKGLSQQEVANYCQTSQRNISRWELGQNEPTSSFIIKLADCFNCSIDYLVGREDDFGIITSSSTVPELRPEEKQLLLDFNKLSDTNKYKVIGYCHALV